MHTKQMTITPELARQFLTQNTNNRAVRRRAVVRHIDDMKAGRFVLMPHGIVFLKDGTLMDGQHRLMAIAECGIPQQMMVTFDADEECRLNHDRIIGRTDYDNMSMAGHSWATLVTVAILKSMVNPRSSSKAFSIGELVSAAAPEVLAAVDLSIQAIPSNKKYLSGAPVRAAVGLAVVADSSISTKRLCEFGAVLSTGFGNGDADSAAVLLRNVLIEKKGMNSNSQDREQAMRLSQVCLKAFLECKPIRRTPKHEDLTWPKIKLGDQS